MGFWGFGFGAEGLYPRVWDKTEAKQGTPPKEAGRFWTLSPKPFSL